MRPRRWPGGRRRRPSASWRRSTRPGSSCTRHRRRRNPTSRKWTRTDGETMLGRFPWLALTTPPFLCCRPQAAQHPGGGGRGRARVSPAVALTSAGRPLYEYMLILVDFLLPAAHCSGCRRYGRTAWTAPRRPERRRDQRTRPRPTGELRKHDTGATQVPAGRIGPFNSPSVLPQQGDDGGGATVREAGPGESRDASWGVPGGFQQTSGQTQPLHSDWLLRQQRRHSHIVSRVSPPRTGRSSRTGRRWR